MKDELLFKLGQSIRYIRLKKGVSQEELGFKASLSTNSVSAIERGAFNFKIKTLYKIAEALEVLVEEIINCKF
ncbi:MAG: helix-turn-helix transcriptional regulator [Candidatus Gastranaerophilales bacterium]